MISSPFWTTLARSSESEQVVHAFAFVGKDFEELQSCRTSPRYLLQGLFFRSRQNVILLAHADRRPQEIQPS